MRKCAHCNLDAEEDAVFCTSCGQQLPKQKRCIKCGKSIDEDCDWCVFCGTKQVVEANDEDIYIPQKECIQCNAEQAVEVEATEEEHSIQPKKSRKTTLVISILLILCLIGGGIFFFRAKQISELDREQLLADSIRLADSIAAVEARHPEEFVMPDQNVSGSESEYGGVKVENILAVASHVLKDQGSNSYQASNLLDNDSNTAWATHFTGEEETLTFIMKTNGLYKIILINGYRKDADSYANNSRAKKVRIYVDEALAAEDVFSNEDYGNSQYWSESIILDREYNNVKEVKVVISSVYEGAKWNDLCISDVDFYTKE